MGIMSRCDFKSYNGQNNLRAVEELQDGDQGLAKHLDGEEGWESWREGKFRHKYL